MKAILLGILLVFGCQDSGDRGLVNVPTPSLDLDSILWSGCTSVVDHGKCEIGEGPLTVWISGDDPGWRWTLDGESVQIEDRETIDGGTRSQLSFAAHSRGGAELELRDPKDEVKWSLSVFPDLLGPQLDSFADRIDEVGKEDAEASLALALAQELMAGVESLEPIERLARIQQARKLNYHKADIGASTERVEPLLRRTIRVAEGLGRWGEQCAAAAVGIFLATHRLDVERVEHWRQWEAPCRERSPRWQVGFDFYLGVIEMRQGHYEEAVLRIGRARKSAARLGLRSYELPVQKDYVESLLRTGRWAEAQRALEALEKRTLEPCVRASLDSDIGFFRVRARQQGDVDLGDPSPVLRRALALHARGEPCENLTLRNHDLIKLGFAAALRGDADELADRLVEIEVGRLSGKYPGQYQELRARDALLRDDLAEAGEALEAMAKRSPLDLEPESRWRRHMLRAELAEREGEEAESIAAYRDAEQVLDEMRQGVASGAVRERWLTSYRRSAVLLVERLIDADRIEEAACAARNARARALASHDLLATRSAAKPSRSSTCERPWSRRADELVLLVVPRERSGWWIFEVRDELVQEVRSLSALPGEGSATESWWDPWSASLQNVEQLRILPSEAAFAVPFHRLGWQGSPLMSQRAVVYGLDLSTSAARIDPATQRRAIVAFADVDPLRSLGRHAPELAELEVSLELEGWILETIEDELLDRSGLRSHLSSVELLHYYGHGTREAIEPGVESVKADDVGTTALLLAGGTKLGVEDVLSLSRVPQWVVLFGCRVGHADIRGWSGGLSLAHAFLLAGARQVVASTEPLDARAAAALGPRLYEGQSPESIDLSHALRNMWSAHVLSGAEEPAWKDLRVWSR